MDQQLKDYLVEHVNALVNAPMTYEGAKKVGEEWLAALGTDAEAEASKKLIAEAEADIMPIDALVSFAESDAAVAAFGDAAPGFLAHAKSLKEAGARYCDCTACAACEAILAKKDELLG